LCYTRADWNIFCNINLWDTVTFFVTLELIGTFSVILKLNGTLIFSVTLELNGTFSVTIGVAGTFSIIL